MGIKLLAIVIILTAVPAVADDWTVTDTALQTTFTALAIADWSQTLKRAPTGTETNPVLGTHPHPDRTAAYFSTAIAGHALVSYLLPKAWRHAWQSVWIVAETHTVARNLRFGYRVGF